MALTLHFLRVSLRRVVQSLYIRTFGLAVSACYAGAIVWLYLHQPQSVAEVTGSLASAVGAYEVDRAAFDEGLRLFRSERFAASRSAFERADPAHKDAPTQFYVAYSLFREGWGRLYNDDQLFGSALEAVNRAAAASPHGVVRVDDPDLGLHTSDELRAELEAGLRHDASDLNPMKIFRKRP
jgi:hypothetical protein